MASGVKVADCTKKLFSEMKVNKTGDQEEERIRLATFKIEDGLIKVDKVIRQKQLITKDCYEMFLEELVESECHYILYDCHYDTCDAHKEDLVFEMWCGRKASLLQKVEFATSKDAIKRVLQGIKHNLEKNDREDFCLDQFIKDVLGPDVVRFEGKDVCKC